MTETVETEVVKPEMAVAVREIGTVGLFGAVQPVEVITRATEVASALKDVLRKQKLISNIQGKEYPKCEAWTLLGTMLGVFPVLVWCRQIEGGWEARVEARTKDGAVIGAAEAECLRAERNWANRDDFALRSMAQTRATAKCLRMPLGFVMTLAGYEATPAEEMTFDSKASQTRVEPPKPSKPCQDTGPSTKTPQTPPQSATAATEAFRATMIQRLEAAPGHVARELVTGYFRAIDALLETEELEELPLSEVPVSKEELEALRAKIAAFENGDKAERAFPRHLEAEAKKPEPAKEAKQPKEDQWWRDIIVPIPHKGQSRSEYLKNTETLGSLYEARHGDDENAQIARQRLWGFVTNYQPKPWTKRDGTQMPPSESDVKFREALDAFMEFFKKNHPDEKL